MPQEASRTSPVLLTGCRTAISYGRVPRRALMSQAPQPPTTSRFGAAFAASVVAVPLPILPLVASPTPATARKAGIVPDGSA